MSNGPLFARAVRWLPAPSWPEELRRLGAALRSPYTYNPARNAHLWLGLAWATPLTLLALVIHAWADHRPMSWDGLTHGFGSDLLHWIALTQVAVATVLFAALGTARRDDQRRTDALIERLRADSERDPLTGLYNRKVLVQALDREIARARRGSTPLALVFFDLDHFKNINDSYGHLEGDAALLRTAELLVHNCRIYDVPARWGGEEFVVVLPGASELEAAQFAERLRDRVQGEQHGEGDRQFSITLSAGVAAYDEDDTVTRLVEKGDRALYQAKADGRNCVRVYLPLPPAARQSASG